MQRQIPVLRVMKKGPVTCGPSHPLRSPCRSPGPRYHRSHLQRHPLQQTRYCLITCSHYARMYASAACVFYALYPPGADCRVELQVRWLERVVVCNERRS